MYGGRGRSRCLSPLCAHNGVGHGSRWCHCPRSRLFCDKCGDGLSAQIQQGRFAESVVLGGEWREVSSFALRKAKRKNTKLRVSERNETCFNCRTRAGSQMQICKNTKFNCNALIFNNIRFCIFVKSCKSTPKKPQKGRFQWQNQAFWSTKPTAMRWVFVFFGVSCQLTHHSIIARR